MTAAEYMAGLGSGPYAIERVRVAALDGATLVTFTSRHLTLTHRTYDHVVVEIAGVAHEVTIPCSYAERMAIDMDPRRWLGQPRSKIDKEGQ